MSDQTTLSKLFIDELRDAYHAEKQLTKALPKLMKAATSPDLRQALADHLDETENHVERLEQVFEMLEEPAKVKVCAGMQGIIEEGSELIKEEDKGPALDAGIIAGAQRAEHYEMAAYGSLMAWAKALGHDEVLELLEATLDEEKAADTTLSELGEGGINEAAAGNGEEDDSEEEPVSANGAKTAKSQGQGVSARSKRR